MQVDGLEVDADLCAIDSGDLILEDQIRRLTQDFVRGFDNRTAVRVWKKIAVGIVDPIDPGFWSHSYTGAFAGSKQ